MVKKFNELNESTDQRIHLISRLLSDYFYPEVSKNTFPVKCDGFSEVDENFEVYFSVWDNNKNDYKSSPITTMLVPKYLIEDIIEDMKMKQDLDKFNI